MAKKETKQEVVEKTVQYLHRIMLFHEIGSPVYLYYKDLLHRFGNKKMMDDFAKILKENNATFDR